MEYDSTHHQHPKAMTSMSYTNSLPPLPTPRSMSVASKSTARAHHRRAAATLHRTPVEHVALNDAPFLVRDKVRALEQFAVMAGPRRPVAPTGEHPYRRKPVPLPVTVVGMQSSVVTTSNPRPPTSTSGSTASPAAYIHPDVHEAIIADTVARLAHVFQHRLHEHAIAATVRHFTRDLVDLSEGARYSRPQTLLEHRWPETARLSRPLDDPQDAAASAMYRAWTPRNIWRASAEEGGQRKTLVPVQPNASSTTPLNHRLLPVDPRHDMKNHPALVAPWCSSAAADANAPPLRHVLDPIMPSPPLRPIPAVLETMPSLNDDASWHVPMAEEALSRILTHDAAEARTSSGISGAAASMRPAAATVSTGNAIPRVTTTPPPQPVNQTKPPHREEAAPAAAGASPRKQGTSAPTQHELATRHTHHNGTQAAGRVSQTSIPLADPSRSSALSHTTTHPAAQQVSHRAPPSPASTASGLLGSDALAAAMAELYAGDHAMLPHQRTRRGDAHVAAVAPQRGDRLQVGGVEAGRTSPRLSEAMDHIVFDAAGGRWSVSQQSSRPAADRPQSLNHGGGGQHPPTSADRPIVSAGDLTSLGSRGSDGMLPVLLVPSGSLTGLAEQATLRGSVSQQGPRTHGAAGHDRRSLNTASPASGTRHAPPALEGIGNHKTPLIDALPRSPFPQSARIAITDWNATATQQAGPLSPRDKQRPHAASSSVGWDKTTAKLPQRTSNSPPSSPMSLAVHRDALVLTPSVEPKRMHPADALHAVLTGRGSQQTAIAHDPSILLRFDDSYTSDLADNELCHGAVKSPVGAKTSAKHTANKARRNDATDVPQRPSTKERVTTSGGGAKIPARVQQLVPIPLTADIPAIPDAVGPRLLSADQPTLEAQIERDVVRGEYDSILAPSRDSKTTIDASVALLQDVVGVKLKFREDLVKKYEALQQVKRSHAEVMQAITAMHSCLAAGKASTDNISLETLLAGIDALTAAPSSAAAAAASSQPAATASAPGSMPRTKSISLSKGSMKKTKAGGKAKSSISIAEPAVDSGDSDSSDASEDNNPKQEASRSVAKKRASKRNSGKGKPALQSDEDDTSDPIAGGGAVKVGPTTAELLREAQRARLSQANTTNAPAPAVEKRYQPRGPGTRTATNDQQPGADDGVEHISAAEKTLKKSYLKATASFEEAKQRYERAHLFMVARGRGIIKNRNNNNNQQMSAGGGQSKSPKSTTKRVPAALEAKLAVMSTTAGLTPAEEREAIAAAISDELQAEFRDINARRDTQRSVAENQERELDDVRQDMKRLTSAGNDAAARDEAAAALTALVQKREQSQLRLQEEAAASVLPSAAAAASAAAANTAGGASFEEDEELLHAHSPDLVETKNVAVQVEADVQGKQKQLSSEQSAQMGDLYRLEHLLLSSVRRLIVAVAHVMMFHRTIEIELTCKGCLTLFRGPRTLWPCGHTFCQACLLVMYGASNDMITCGECGTLTDIGFTPDPILQDLAFYQTQYKNQGNFALHSDDGEESDADDDETIANNNKPKMISFDYGTSASTGVGSPASPHGKRHRNQSNTAKGSLQDVLEELLNDLVGAETQNTAVAGSFDSDAGSRTSSQ